MDIGLELLFVVVVGFRGVCRPNAIADRQVRNT
jgi:hypothetical protein